MCRQCNWLVTLNDHLKVVSAFNRTSLGIFSHKVSTMAVEKAFLCMDTVTYRYWWDYNPPVHRKWEPSGRHWRCTMHSLVNNQPAPGIWQGQQAPLRHQPQQLELQVPSLPPPLLDGYFYCVSVNVFFFLSQITSHSAIPGKPGAFTDFQGTLLPGHYKKNVSKTFQL